MGLCYSSSVKSIENSYDIILKIPHDEKCYQINHKNNKWEYNENINHSLKKLYTDKLTNWVVYNDEHPDINGISKTVSTGAHAKGILAWNDKVITWLIHSLPKFPQLFDGTNNFPDIDHAELQYGQSFIFIKMDILHLDNILKQLFIMHPSIYISNFNYDSYKYEYKHNEYNIYKINKNIDHVSKSPNYHKDLYEDIVIPNFIGPCYTETWVRGHHCIDNEQCKMINKIKWNNDLEYTFTHDHSKYCYSDQGWVMVGDLNRMTTQSKRGGGGIIIKDKKISHLFKEISVY